MTSSRFYIVISFILSASALFGQTRLKSPEMYIGIHGGAVASTVQFSPSVNGTGNLVKAAVLGANGGAVFRYYGHRYCGLQTEINYMQRGWKENYAATDTTSAGTYIRRLQYVELPFMMHIYFGNNSFRGYVNLGPQIGYCFNDKWSGTQQTTDTNQYAALDNPFDWGVTAGAGMYYRTQKAGAVQIEMRFNYSLNNYFKSNKSAYFNDSHSLDLSLNIGYLWEIKNKK